jgi:hypothetical protein
VGSYNGLATIKTGDSTVEVLACAQSGVEAASGLGCWRGTFSTTDDGAAFALMQVDEATIELADENGYRSPPRSILQLSAAPKSVLTGQKRDTSPGPSIIRPRKFRPTTPETTKPSNGLEPLTPSLPWKCSTN